MKERTTQKDEEEREEKVMGVGTENEERNRRWETLADKMKRRSVWRDEEKKNVHERVGKRGNRR